MSPRVVLSPICALLVTASLGPDAHASRSSQSPPVLHLTYTRADVTGEIMTTNVFSREIAGPDGGRSARTFFARRSATGANGARTEAETVLETCPALYAVLVSADQLVAPRFSFPSLVGSPPEGARLRLGPIVPPDASSFTVEGTGRQPDGSSATLKISAHDGPTANFVVWADEEMAACWQPADLAR